MRSRVVPCYFPGKPSAIREIAPCLAVWHSACHLLRSCDGGLLAPVSPQSFAARAAGGRSGPGNRTPEEERGSGEDKTTEAAKSREEDVCP